LTWIKTLCKFEYLIYIVETAEAALGAFETGERKETCMIPTLFSRFCCMLIHACAFLCAAASTYFFVVSTIDYVLVALVLFGAAVGLEVIAVVIGANGSAV
jgi:hypothetical protein